MAIRLGRSITQLLLLTCVAVPAAHAATADTVILHGHVYSANGTGTFAQAVAIKDGYILATGSDAEIERMRDARTRVIDAKGGAVTPGIIDTHVHFLMGASALDQFDATGARDGAELSRRVKAFADAHPERPWLLGFGYFSDALTARDFDVASGGKPVVIRAGDGHSMLANGKALALAGITRTTPDPIGGKIVRDAAGNPTGHLLETAQGLMAKAVPAMTDADRMRLLRLGTQAAYKAGVTSILNVGGTDDLAVFERARAAGTLGIRIYSALWLTKEMATAELPQSFDFDRAALARFNAVRAAHKDDPMLRAGIVKIMLDGVIESHTASMLAPYTDDPATSGHANYTPEQLRRIITMMDADGWQVMTHGLGDRAVRIALDAYEAAAKANPAPARGRRHKIEHVETIDPADVPRFGQLGVTASLQPDHGGGMNDPKQEARRWKYLGYTRSAWGFPWKSIKASGGRVAFGSDWPVAPLDIGPGMAVATQRVPHPPIPDQALSVAEVIDAYTRDAAYSIFADKEIGTLEPGKRADIVVFRDDIFAGKGGATLPAAYTLLDGKVVYQAAQ
ncbi:MAG: amidohydrolase [Sphingomonadales bacterium]|nr:amidohydrolase [Sphingomonadales bacterium]